MEIRFALVDFAVILPKRTLLSEERNETHSLRRLSVEGGILRMDGSSDVCGSIPLYIEESQENHIGVRPCLGKLSKDLTMVHGKIPSLDVH